MSRWHCRILQGRDARDLVIAALTAALLAGSAAHAQESDEPAATSRVTVGDWAVECYGPEDSGPNCQMYQRVLTQDPLVAAMVATFAWSSEEQALRTQIALPLGVSLRHPPVLLIDTDAPVNLTWTRCISDGCLVEGTIDPQLIDRLSRADQAGLGVMRPEGEPVRVPLSLARFSDALAAILPEDQEPLETAND